MKFSHKIIIAAASIIIFTFIMSALFSYRRASQDFDDMTRDAAIESLEGVSRAVGHWISGKVNNLSLLGEVIENTDFAYESVEAVMRRPTLNKEFLLIVGAADADGRAIKNLDSWDPGAGWDARKRPWYTLARDHKKTMITSPYADAVTNEILISVARPIMQAQQFWGVVVGDVSLTALQEMMNAVNQKEGHYSFLFSESGMIIAHPDPSFNGKNISEMIQSGTLDIKKEKVFQDLTVLEQESKVMLMALEHLATEDKWLLGIVYD